MELEAARDLSPLCQLRSDKTGRAPAAQENRPPVEKKTVVLREANSTISKLDGV